MNLYLLIALPIATYMVSYLYLAYYHGQLLIFNTIVHEGGTFTLLQDMFYASHFLGHIPVQTMLAILFVGAYLSLTPGGQQAYRPKRIFVLIMLIILLVAGSFVLSIRMFGHEDTMAFIMQQKQTVTLYVKGGSWNLHLPSSMLFFLFIPVYVYVVKRIFDSHVEPATDGLFYVALAMILLFFLTFLFNGSVSEPIAHVWKNPRYLGHAVRELMTFPVTYFPIPLFFMLREEKKDVDTMKRPWTGKLEYFMVGLAVLFLIGLAYQSFTSLSAGIGDLAQKPSFAKGGKLGIPYLLASHYFEHFLDTIYFSLLCLLLYGFAVNRTKVEPTK